jgi:lysophospholipase L1-like esterase
MSDPPRRQPQHADDNLMERFEQAGNKRFTARDALIAIGVTAAILIVCAGASIRKAGNEMKTGIGRDAVLAIGRPAGAIADNLPFHRGANRLTSFLSPNQSLNGPGGFSASVAAGITGAAGGVGAVTPDAFTPASLGLPSPPRRKLHTLLVTGDSMSQPLDEDLAQTLDPSGVHVIQDPHIGTGISNTVIVDWGKLSVSQVKHDHPDAVVVFIGANDGYSMTGPGHKLVNCCTAEWAAIYATRARELMNTYRQNGVGRVYWLTLPTPRDHARAMNANVVNAAIDVAAEPWATQVRIINTVPVFTPGGKYRDSMTINGEPTIVRQSDGIHLNDAGSSLAAKIVLQRVRQDFTY